MRRPAGRLGLLFDLAGRPAESPDQELMEPLFGAREIVRLDDRRSSFPCLQLLFEIRERRHSLLRVLVNSPVVNQPDGHGIGETLFPPRLLRNHEVRGIEDVLHYAEAGHVQPRFELGQRLALALEEHVESVPARRIRQSLEDAVGIHELRPQSKRR